MRFLLLLCLLLASVSGRSEPTEVETGQWQLAANLGVGVATNPLYGGDNFPLILVPDIAWYGERWYFDNGQLGYTLAETTRHALSLVGEFNPETRFFVDWHPANLLGSSGGAMFAQQEGPSRNAVDLDRVARRSWALEGGLSYHYFSDFGVLNLAWFSDISSVHKGGRFVLDWQQAIALKGMTLTPQLGVRYHSGALNDYFYGLSEKDGFIDEISLGSGWLPYAKLALDWPLDRRNAVRFYLAYYDYAALADSPLLRDNKSVTAFLGLRHVF